MIVQGAGWTSYLHPFSVLDGLFSFPHPQSLILDLILILILDGYEHHDYDD